jgi:hypothetical protein
MSAASGHITTDQTASLQNAQLETQQETGKSLAGQTASDA